MRRIAIGLVVVFTLLLVTSVAGATPPGFCEDGRVHPACPDPDLAPPCPTGTWTITGKSMTDVGCLWTPINNGSEIATVTVSNIEDSISGPPTVFVRDDSPGDICVLAQDEEGWELKPGTEGPEYEASFDLFNATLGQSYWDFVWQQGMEPGTHWCAAQDGNLASAREDTNGGALHLRVAFNAKKGGSLDITLFPENSL